MDGRTGAIPCNIICPIFQTDVKKVKCQCTTLILATLVYLPSLIICAKIQPQGILGSGEEDIKNFLPYMGKSAILVNGP